jgi:hypothetical protein
MPETTSNWWWLPGALLLVAGLLFMVVAAIESRPAVWISVGVVFLLAGGMNLRRRTPQSDDGAGPAP